MLGEAHEMRLEAGQAAAMADGAQPAVADDGEAERVVERAAALEPTHGFELAQQAGAERTAVAE